MIKEMNFIPTKFSRVSIFYVKRQVNLIENFMTNSISCPCNSQYIKTKLQQINLAKLLKTKNLIFFLNKL